MKKALFTLAGVILLAAGCNSNPKIEQMDQASEAVNQPQGIQNPDTASVLQFVYGNYNTKDQTANWTVSKSDVDSATPNQVYDIEATSSIGTVYQVTAYASSTLPGGDFLVLTQTVPGP